VETATAFLDVVLNGEPHRVPEGSTVADLVAALRQHPRTVAVERNGELVPRARFGETLLGAGDRLEVVHFVQGG
jgi:thiamine biosynthesis protein ThiS